MPRYLCIYGLATLLWAFSGQIAQGAPKRAAGDPNDSAATPGKTDPVEIGVAGTVQRENPYQTAAEARLPVHLHTFWESRYVTEGRDNLDGDPLASASSDIAFGDLTIAPWVAHGYESDYTELNFNVVYGFRLAEQVEFYAGYTRLQTRASGDWDKDNEVSAELIYSPTSLFDVLVTGYYSFEAKGAFWEGALRHEQTLDDQTILTVYGILGANDGYVAEGHNGLNHAQLRLDLAYYPVPYLEIVPYVAYNFAIDRDPERFPDDHTLRDFYWAGIGVIYHF